MNRFKLQGYVKEFPFLEAILGAPADVTDVPVQDARFPDSCGDFARRAKLVRPGDPKDLQGIKICRLDSAVLNAIPSEYHWDGSVVDISKVERVFFALSSGEIIFNAVHTEGTDGSNYAHSDTREWDGETILEAIDRLEVADSIKFIVWTRKGFTVRDHHSGPEWDLTIYKESKTLKLSAAIEAARAAALEEVRAEANF